MYENILYLIIDSYQFYKYEQIQIPRYLTKECLFKRLILFYKLEIT